MYEYHVRPGFESGELLIEFAPKKADKQFLSDLLDALQGLGTRVRDIQEIWMNDEVLLHCESNEGSFLISKDNWDLVFILAPDNQPVLSSIDESLSHSSCFSRRRTSTT